MVSATFDSQSPDVQSSWPPMAQVKQFAASGYFQAIALWVNQPLVPYSIYAQIKPDSRPGCLQIVLEFKRPPNKERLIRLLCSRLWQLQSELIEGVHIMARPVGQTHVVWQRRIRLRRSVSQSARNSANNAVANAAVQPAARRSSQTAPTVSHRQPLRRSAHRAMRRSRSAVDRQFKIVRAALLSGSVAAAFVAGCLTEVMMSRSPSLPNLGIPNDRPQTADPVQGTSVAYTQTAETSLAAAQSRQPRANSIQAALEPVAVMPHDQVSDPNDPTVTLMFGGEVTLGNVDLSAPDTADQLLQGLPTYPQADVSMVNLGNPLATAGTSIQEDYYRRTRRDAVAALRRGGVDIVGLAGDRTMELGEQGLLETLTTLDQAGIYRVGAGRDQREARRPEILDVKGQRIAYLSYHADPAIPATAKQAGTNQPTRQAIVEDIAAIRDAVDWVVVNYRWVEEDLGVEPTSEQVELSRRAVDAGADLVVGYHPQQLQGAEVYKGRAIVYALGDFIFADAPLEDRETAALRVSLKPQQMKVEFLPVAVRRARPMAATGEQGEAILQTIRRASAQLEQPLSFPAVLTVRATPTAKPLPEFDETPSLGGEIEPSESTPTLFERPEQGRSTDAWPLAPLPEKTVPVSPEPQPAVSEGWPDNGLNNGSGLGSETEFEISPWDDESPLNHSDEPDSPWDTPVLEPLSEDGVFEDNFIAPAAENEALVAPTGADAGVQRRSSTPDSWPEAPAETDLSPHPVDNPARVEPSLPKLNDWGPKQSPHKEFEPIRNGQPLSLDGDEPSALPMGAGSSSEPDRGPIESLPGSESNNGAIGPYSEPLVGPLSHQPPVDESVPPLVGHLDATSPVPAPPSPDV